MLQSLIHCRGSRNVSGWTVRWISGTRRMEEDVKHGLVVTASGEEVKGDEVRSPLIETLGFRKQINRGPFRLLNNRRDGLDTDWGYKDLSRLAFLHDALKEHVEFLRSEGDRKLDELRYAKIQIGLRKSMKIIHDVCNAMDMPVTRLTDVEKPPITIPRSVMSMEKCMEVYDLHDTLREFMFQMDKLEPEESCISSAYTYLKWLPRELFKKDPRHPEDVQPEIKEDELEANKAEMIKSSDLQEMLKGWHTVLISLRRMGHMSKGGRVNTFQAVVGVGNMKGAGGVGKGNSRVAQMAIQRATKEALRTLVQVDLHERRTIYHPISSGKPKFMSLWPLPPGAGLRVSSRLSGLLAIMGIKDLGGKIMGGRNKLNDVKSLMQLLKGLKSAREVAKGRGKKVVELRSYMQGVLTEVDQIRAQQKLYAAEQAILNPSRE